MVVLIRSRDNVVPLVSLSVFTCLPAYQETSRPTHLHAFISFCVLSCLCVCLSAYPPACISVRVCLSAGLSLRLPLSHP